MTFETKKFNEIFDEMRARTSVITDFEVGSVARTIYESFAYEVALLYEKMRLVYLSAYVDTAEGHQLDNVVSILGIKRGLPDFAIGVVTFERDVGNEDIDIPLGTLIATEETPDAPRKVYQTFEDAMLPSDHTSVDVKVRAVDRGEDQTTPGGAVVVMPRPVPGIKSVINHEAIQFIGKRRESDGELQERAKNALISSGKASIVSIENALLSLPGVKDVKVKENFHFARGKVTFQRNSGSGDVAIPRNTLLKAVIASQEKIFETTEQVLLANGETSVEVTVRSLLEGKAGEVPKTVGVTWTIESAGLETLGVINDAPIRLGEFGIIEVFVDGPDFNEPAEKERILKEIERVRAAGIFVLLESVRQIDVDGVFRIEIDPALSLSEEEQNDIETTVKGEIENLLRDFKMGQSFLFSKLIKQILSLEGIENLDDFQITTVKEIEGVPTETAYVLSDRRIDNEEFERFRSRHICVASGNKVLPVNIQFKATGLNSLKLNEVLNALGNYFKDLELGANVSKGEVVLRINSVSGVALDAPTLKLSPQSWCRRVLFSGDDVHVTFVEQPVLGNVFAYENLLHINGAVKLTLPPSMTGQEKEKVQDEIRSRIEDYLDSLESEQDAVYEDLVNLVSGVNRVLAVDLNWQDFRAEIGGTDLPERVTDEKIELSEFEKAALLHFCITGSTETVTITVSAVSLELLAPASPPAELINEIKQTVKNTINNFLSDASPGQDLVFSELKSAIEGLVTGADYIVTALTLQANSACDGRLQSTDLATARTIHVRSVELPEIVPITAGNVVVNTS